MSAILFNDKSQMNRRLHSFATSLLSNPTTPSFKPTQKDYTDLQRTASELRTELDRVIIDEVAGDEARGAASDTIAKLRGLALERRKERDALRKRADEACADCNDVHEACKREERRRGVLNQEINRLNKEMRCALHDTESIREEVTRIQNVLVTEDAETIFRLRAEVQNMKTECEMEEIKVRKLSSQKEGVQYDLETKCLERDEVNCHIQELQKEIKEAKSELEMNRARHEILSGQLIGMGGTIPNESIFSSVRDLLTKKSCIDVARVKPKPQNDIVRSTSDNNISQRNRNQTSKHTHELNSSFVLGVAPNDIQPQNNVYSKLTHQGKTLLCKQHEDGSVVSALTLDETEFPSVMGGEEDE